MATKADAIQYPREALTPTLKIGLVFIGVIAITSVLSTVALTSFIGYRASRWSQYFIKDIKKNVFVVLLCNLFLADFIQAFGFIFSWHWLAADDILTGTGSCVAQGFMINFGDIASAFFVLSIALQTWAHLRFQQQLRYDAFLAVVVCIWTFALMLSILGPTTSSNYFVDTGAWCWVDAKYTSQRLAYHYFWIFLVEFGGVVVYGFVIWELRKSSRRLRADCELPSPQARDTYRRIRKSCLIMCCYPIAYIALTLPLAVSRMYEVRGVKSSLSYRIFCGCFLVSSGWVDALLYVLTRASFLKSQGHFRDSRDEATNRRRSGTTSMDGKAVQGPATVLHSPALSYGYAVPLGGPPARMHSTSSYHSDTNTLSHSNAEEPLSAFSPELLLTAGRSLALNAKVDVVHEAH